jgi:hypothetical protein
MSKCDIYSKTISIIENIYMKQRMMEVSSAIKTTDSKDLYLDSQFKNMTDEPLADAANYGVDIVVSKLVISCIAPCIAQNLRIIYHEASDELCYYKRKHDSEMRAVQVQLVNSIIERGRCR